MFDSGKINKIELKLYLEGIEIPLHSIQIMEVAGTFPQANLSIPLDDSGIDILPRTTVHVFYKDSFTEDRWLLIFEGEVTGVNLAKSSNTRNISLDCVGIINHWQYATKVGSSFSGIGVQGQKAKKVMVTCYSEKSNEKYIPEDIREFNDLIRAIDTSGINEDLAKDIQKVKKAINLENNEDGSENLTSQFLFTSSILPTINAITLCISKSLEKGKTDTTKALKNIFQALSKEFARSNIGYSIFHVVYRMVHRFLVFPNSTIDTFLKSDLGISFLKNSTQQMSNSTTLIDIITKIATLINYSLIFPAAPTYDVDDKFPQSVIAIPEPHTFLPLACNTIFKDEVINANFTRNFISEPTRLGVIAHPQLDIGGNSVLADLLEELVMAPSSKLNYEVSDNEDVSLNLILTKEERLRGVAGVYVGDNFSAYKAAQDTEIRYTAKKDEEEKNNSTTKEISQQYTDEEKKKRAEEVRNFTITLRKKYADNLYRTKVGNARKFSLITSYSPYRLCGMPGVYLDDKLPCIIGNIASITSTITANGEASSQITFFGATLIKNFTVIDNISPNPEEGTSELDWWLNYWGVTEEITTEWKKAHWPFPKGYVATSALDGKEYTFDKYGDNGKASDQLWITYLKFKMACPDDLPFLNTWFDADTYFPDVIGEKVYRKMVYGVKDKDAANMSDKDKTYFGQSGEKLDGGITKYSDDPYNGFTTFNTGKESYWGNVYQIGKNITKVLSRYNSSVASGNTKTFINNFTRRNIITEDDFWRFLINLKDININQIENSEADPLGENIGLGIRTISASIYNERKRIINMIAKSGAASAPFIKERREVVKRFKNKLLTRDGVSVGE